MGTSKLFSLRGVEIASSCAGLEEVSGDDVIVMRLAPTSRVAIQQGSAQFQTGAPIVCARAMATRQTPELLVFSRTISNAGTGLLGTAAAEGFAYELARQWEIPATGVLPLSFGLPLKIWPMGNVLTASRNALNKLHSEALDIVSVLGVGSVSFQTIFRMGEVNFSLSGFIAGSSGSRIVFMGVPLLVDQPILEELVQCAASASLAKIVAATNAVPGDTVVLVATGGVGATALTSWLDERVSALKTALQVVGEQLAQAWLLENGRFVLPLLIEGATDEGEAFEVSSSIARVWQRGALLSDHPTSTLWMALSSLKNVSLESKLLKIAFLDKDRQVMLLEENRLFSDAQARFKEALKRDELPELVVCLGRGGYRSKFFIPRVIS